MKKTALVIMAAGIGSRFGGGIKQLEPVGPNGEIIMDYSIHDALEAGFDRIIFVIRHDLEEDFKEVIGNRIEKIAPVTYAFQELSDVPEGFSVPADRKKPWGTGQAILSIRGLVEEPFLVINADDYYGKEAFVKLHDFLVYEEKTEEELSMAMAGFLLDHTLSANGTVTRGVCITEGEQLTRVVETYGIKEEDGVIVCDDPEVAKWIHHGERVSMNMWAAPAAFIDKLEAGFAEFLESLNGEAGEREYLLPTIVDQMIQNKTASVKVLETHDHWFGITYQEDKEAVQKEFARLIEEGVYPEKLWAK